MYFIKLFLFFVLARSGLAGYGIGQPSNNNWQSGPEDPQSDVSAPRYTPAYMKYQGKPSYGYYPPHLHASSGGVKTAGVKTAGVKTAGVKTAGVKTAGGGYNSPYSVKSTACDPLPFMYINNAKIACDYGSGFCKITCIDGYQFPFEKTSRAVFCQNHRWLFEEPLYEDNQPCEPLCQAGCLNNGICISPDQCECAAGYSGPRCEHENKPCVNFPPPPMNAHRSCSSELCTVKCMQHHQFPDGSVLTNMFCRNGQWVPSRADWPAIPDCKPTCDPPCLNGGACLSLNTCQCPLAFRGPQCQYSSSACSVAKLGYNGGYECSGDADSFWCELRCPAPSAFSSPPAPRYTCLYATGRFEPQPLPRCEYGHNRVIGGGASTGSVYHPGHPDRGDLGGVEIFTPGTYSTHIPHTMKNDSNLSKNQGGYYGSNADNEVTVVTPTPGVCFTWGGAHYKTFDGQVYSFQSPCRHILVRDSVNHLFTVIVQHGGCRGSAPCPSRIHVFLQDKEYIVSKDDDGGIKFSTTKRLIPIPARLPGISITLLAHTVVINLESVGASVKWDTNQLVQVWASESLWNRTEGLCGILDGYKDTDLLTKDWKRPKTIATLADSWEVKKIEDICDASPSTQHACQGKPAVVSGMAERFCKQLLTNKKFQKCAKVLDISLLLDACEWDYCSCAPDQDPEECACGSLAVYAKQCVLNDIPELQNWRDNDTCPMKCTDGKVYNACGPEAQPSCVLPSTSVAPTLQESCTEGCFCAEGLFFNEGKCIPKQECPCRLRNKNFNSGSVIPKGCNTCKCEGGEWTCTQVNCGARCGAIGDPHYTTFDGRHYDFMGKCSYHLLAGDNYTIDVENVACPGAISENMNLGRKFSAGASPSCTKAVTINYGGAVVKLNQRGIITVNGVEIKELPAQINQMVVRSVSSLFIIVELPNGIDVFWDTVTRVFVDVPASFRDKTKGLCGTFNYNQKDDFLTPEGDVEQSVWAFVNKWKTREVCDDVTYADLPDTCQINVQNKETAEKYCRKLKGDLFKDCHWHVDVEPFYQDCMYDMCACEGRVSECMCPILGAYATECASQGVKINWRLQVKECEIPCSGGQSYQVCADSCTRTCSDVSHNVLKPTKGGRGPCQSKCVEGCACAPGQAIHVNGECIPVGMCPCHHDGLEFRPGYKEVRDGRKQKVFCVCEVGKWKCRAATPEEILTYPRASDIKDKCSAEANMEFTTCESAEPLTCKNMHISQSSTTAECRPGCQCKKGYVLESVSKKCVLAVDCPCHHGGQSYPDGHKRPEECNTCECKKGKWECTERQCNGVCNAWGDSHFTTFDGKDFDFQGVCTYLMAQGVEGENVFTVEIQNEPCGTTGATCAKSIILKVGSGPKEETVALTKHNPIPDTSNMERIKVHEAGAFVFLDVYSMGVVLQWDKATRVYVKVDPKWKGRVKGLCGNYNDDIRDDFETPSGGGIAEASPLLFADAWRLTPTCPPATAVQDHCDERPFRKDWATTTCGALHRPPFTKCHSEVPPDVFVQRCERDACACDSGGDCECVCIALATYSQLCAARGVIFKWRSKELCPCQCEEETSVYDPCISACPEETCENTLHFDGVKKMCKEDTCVEGCRLIKKCPQGSVFSNNTLSECVPRGSCKPPCTTLADGRVVLEGETLEEDECHACRCSRGQRVCSGQPCSTLVPELTYSTSKASPTYTPSTATPGRITSTSTSRPEWTPGEEEGCTTGWSVWVNNRQVKSTLVNGQEVSKEHEELPLIDHLFNSLGSGVCEEAMMTDIECRTVGDHKSSNELPMATACSLDRGFTCRALGSNKCPDVEIRVFCNCTDDEELLAAPPRRFPQCLDVSHPNHEHPTDCHKFYQCVPGTGPPEHPHLVEKTCGGDMWYNPDTMTCDWPNNVMLLRPLCFDLATGRSVNKPSTFTTTTTESYGGNITEKPCADGEVWSECPLECNKLCHGYAKRLRAVGKCVTGKECEPGCAPKDEAGRKCEAGLLWRDRDGCVPQRDCTCASRTGAIVKPGGVRHEENCVVCQCLNNEYSCHETACVTTDERGIEGKPAVKGESRVLERGGPTSTTPKPFVFVMNITTSPPPVCSEDRYQNLLWEGKTPNVVLSASSSASDDFAPHNAILNGNRGAGSWTPAISDLEQYIQVEFPRREPIYGLLMQGSPLFTEYVTNYEVMYGDDGIAFSYVKSPDGIPRIFQGPHNNREPAKQIFASPIEAKYLRVKPLTWNDRIAVRLEVIGCREPETTTAGLTTTTAGHTPTHTAPPHISTTPYELPQCTEPMGFSNGLPKSNVQVSSEQANVKNLDVNQELAWKPTFSSPGEWIFFDFTGLRNVTGVVTKGGPDGWVTRYKVMYAPEMEDHIKYWSFITNDDGSEKVFSGNFDSNTPAKNLFKRPVHMRYMKILPQSWNKNIEMRVEPLGCYLPYPVKEEPDKSHNITGGTSPTPPSTRADCQLCPGLVSDSPDCSCSAANKYFDGEGCTTLQLCPCFVGLIPYPVEATFKNGNCEDCTCKMGGVSDCVPAQCPKCAPGLVPKKSVFCDCSCLPCPAGERVCPTSEVCVPESKWCDGITDCPDDELNCLTTTTTPVTVTSEATTAAPTTTTKPKEKCAEPTCPPGYKASVVARRPSYQRQRYSDSAPVPQDSLLSLPPPRPRKTYNQYYKGTKGGSTANMYAGTKTKFPGLKQSSAFTLSRPTTSSEASADECPQFKCVSKRRLPGYKAGGTTPAPPPCPVTTCPPGYKLNLDRKETVDFGQCPRYSCIPPPKKDSVCNVTDRTINTFDGTQYKYDICDHLLARDSHGDKWSVIIQKNCTLVSACARELLIAQDGDHIRMLPSLRVEYNGYPYTVDQTKRIGLDKETFILSRNGDVLFFVSKKYPFWVTYNMQGDVKIGVAASLSGAVDGLCGYYDGKAENDRRLPAGNQVLSTEVFGNAWARPDLPPNACEARVCPLDLQAKGWDMCNVISEKTLSVCSKVMNLGKWREQCLERVCACAQAGNAAPGRGAHECLCEALQGFVVECQAADRTIDLQGWRTEMKCPAECPAPLVHQDCYRRRCEPTCSSTSEGAEQCEPAPGVCFPGCFCPEGKLRKGDDCVSPQDCRDCVCDGKGTPSKYTTFERADLPFSGNCTYIVARDKKKKADYKFQVFVTNGACEKDPKSVCAEAVHIIHGLHVLHVQKNINGGKLDVSVDGSPVYKSVKTDWLELKMLPGKDVSILIPEVQLEVNSLFKNMDFNVKVPSYLYANRTEGLCGNCQGFENVLRTQNGTVAKDVQEYGISWLADKPALKTLDIKVEKSCAEKPKNECLPLPPDQDPCFKIMDPQAFGKCHPVVDPIQYVAACQQDLCLTGKQLGVCSSLEQYATECRRAGLCVDWRSKDLCPYPCEGDLKYKSCGLGCALTCENYEDLSKYPKKCDAPISEGCFCPEGKVLVNNKCIEHTKCFPCDAEQQHYAGDEWQVDACSKCTCVKSERDNSARVACTKQSCSPPVCAPDQLVEAIPLKPSQCCQEYMCVPKGTESPLCEEPQKITCSYGQDLKLERNSKGCKKYSCQCKPPSECERLPNANEVQALEPGMERVVDTSDCCPREEFVCKKETCPQPPACPQFRDLKPKNVTGKCCLEYECVLPEDKCIVNLEWESKPEGGEKQRARPETVLKPVDGVWTDGACHTCRCVRAPGGPTAQCSRTDCPPILSSDTLSVEPVGVPYACCPVPKYVACKHADVILKAGENFTSPAEPCVSFECVPTDDGKLEKRTTVQKCDTDCQLGYEYAPATPGSAACCGLCRPVACVVNGTTRAVGQVWTSDDQCTTYHCDKNQAAEVWVRSSSVACPEATPELLQQYEVQVVSVLGECCDKYEPVACKYDGRVYQEGETWTTPQACVNATCARDNNGRLSTVEQVQACSEECPRGFTYLPSRDQRVCCGQCKPTACVDGDQLRQPSTTWQSDDNCTTFSCTEMDGQLALSSHREACPDVTACKPENIYTRGCCRHCKPAALSHSACVPEEVPSAETVGLVEFHLKGVGVCTNTAPLPRFTRCVGGCSSSTVYNKCACAPEELATAETVGLVSVSLMAHGECTNQQPIVGFKQCRGGCPSETSYNKNTRKHDLYSCTCCRPSTFTYLDVKLTCRIGSRPYPHKVPVPTACECVRCSEETSHPAQTNVTTGSIH